MNTKDINDQPRKSKKTKALVEQDLAQQLKAEFALMEKTTMAKSELDVPTPDVTAIAKKHGVTVSQIESQLKMGIDVELEHTTDRAVAHEIALDHLNELPDYYTRLKEVESGLNETLTKVDGKWALVSKTNPDKVLQYYRGHGKPSKEWVSKVERRVHSFESKDPVSAIATEFRLKTKDKYPDVTVDVFGSGNSLRVSKIEVPKDKRKLGIATDLMKSLANLGDRHQLLISLSPTNEFGASKNKLIEFYKRFGFVMNKGKNKDFTISDTMYRMPSVVAEGVGRITKQNQTADVGPNEIAIQAAKFGNKVNKDGYPPILDKKAAKNTTPHILSNIGLAEAKILSELDADLTNLSPLVRRMVRRAKTKFPYAETDLEAVISLVHKNTLDARKGVDKVDRVNRIQQDQIDTLDQEYDQLDTEINQEDQTIRDLQREVRRLERIKDQLDRKNAQQDIVIDKLNSTRREEISGLEKEIDKLKAAYNRFSVSESTDQIISEVEMSPGALRAWSEKIKISDDIKFGFEAELVFARPGGYDEENSEQIPDYEEDREIKDFDDLEDWLLTAGAYSRTVKTKIQALREEFDEWFMDSRNEYANSSEIKEKFRKESEERWERNSDQLINDELASRGFTEEEIDKIFEDPESEEYIDAAETAKEAFDEDIENQIDDIDGDYADLVDENFEIDVTEFFEEKGISRLSEFIDYIDGEWPYYDIIDNLTAYDVDAAQELAGSLESKLGIDVEVSSAYHGGIKDLNKWYFEPDSSIEVNPGETVGLPIEIVSPPMPILDGLKKMEQFFKWADSEDAYTNASTGFHVGVSSAQQEKLDYMKLVLFLGDEWVVKQFKREFNNYARQNLKTLKRSLGDLQQAQGAEILLADFLKNLRSGALKDAGRLIERTSRDKMFVINMKHSYVEFRAAGNAGYNAPENIEKLKTLVLRYAMAYQIASDPDAFREEYAKRLYKLLSETFQTLPNGIDLFANYSAGLLTRGNLKKALTVVSKAQAKQSFITPDIRASLYLEAAIETLQNIVNSQKPNPELAKYFDDVLTASIEKVKELKKTPDMDVAALPYEIRNIIRTLDERNLFSYGEVEGIVFDIQTIYVRLMSTGKIANLRRKYEQLLALGDRADPVQLEKLRNQLQAQAQG